MNNIRLKFQLLIGILTFMLFGCDPKYYIPNTQNVPIIKSKGQSNLTVTGNGNQFEFQGAYGISDDLALQANGGIISPKDADNGDGGSGKFIEAGLGYYRNLNPNLLVDAYGLIGFGTMENHFPNTLASNPNTTGKIMANLIRFGIQPGISYHRNYFSISGSARIMNLNYSNINGSLIFNNEDQIKYLNDNKSNFIIEPALTLRAGLEKMKFQLQLMKSFNLSNSNFKQDKSLVSFGLNFNFN